MKLLWMLTVAVAIAAGASDAYAGRYSKGGEGALKLRYFTAEVPPSAAGGRVRVGVKLPLGARIAKTEVFVDVEDKGNSKGWSECDIKRKTCSVGDVRILGFHRDDEEDWQSLSVDLESGADAARFAKLTVLFQTSSGSDRTGCQRASPRCGFSGPVE